MNQGRRLSIRLRLTIIFVGVIAVIGLSASALIVGLADHAQNVAAGNEVVAALNSVQAQIGTQQLYATEPLTLHTPANVVVQVVNLGQRQVLAASKAIDGEPIIAHAHSDFASANGLAARILPRADHTDGPFVLGHVRIVSTGAGPALAFGFYSETTLAHTHNVLLLTIVSSFPALLIIIGLLLWVALGLTLAPVEMIRRRVESIAAADLSQRVPQLGGNDEIAKLTTTLNEMLSRLELASTFEQEFISNASHELRSPLATLLATVERARLNPDAANWEQVSESVLREVRRMTTLVDEMFWLARHDEGHLEPVFQELDVDDILFEEAERIATLSHLNVRTTNVSPSRMMGDEGMMRRLVRNLTDNAMRYARSEISLASHIDGDHVTISVANDGPEVEPSEGERYFERFARGDAARSRAQGGTGLGLTIVREIAQLHGGEVHFVPVASGAQVVATVRVDGRPSAS